jgi:hypothetical protein
MKKIIAFVALALPSVALAQGTLTTITNVNGVSSRLLGIGSTVIYVLVALAVLFIVYNVVMYLVRGADPAAKSAAGMNVLWGIVGLFVIVSIWGLVNILTGTFNTTPTNQPIPNFGGQVQTGGFPANQAPIVQ